MLDSLHGAFHDGGLLLAFPDRYLGLFLGFQTQRIPTDAAGNAAPGASAISQILAGDPPFPPARSPVYIERALINPSGADPGREVVVLASLATTAQTLTNWRLVDRTPGSHRSTPRSGPGNPCSSRSTATVFSSVTREAT
jgi:hypothetical protein